MSYALLPWAFIFIPISSSVHRFFSFKLHQADFIHSGIYIQRYKPSVTRLDVRHLSTPTCQLPVPFTDRRASHHIRDLCCLTWSRPLVLPWKLHLSTHKSFKDRRGQHLFATGSSLRRQANTESEPLALQEENWRGREWRENGRRELDFDMPEKRSIPVMRVEDLQVCEIFGFTMIGRSLISKQVISKR
jgi:hypothetical protein